MTMVFSAACAEFIVMANDCAVVRAFSDGHFEYDTGPKSFGCDGVGCVTMWGGRDGNNLITHLSSVGLSPDRHSVEDLARLVNRYLVEEYAPSGGDIGDTGFHIGGFTSGGEARLYHAFWNAPGSTTAVDTKGAYSLQLHHPSHEFRFLYNGRNDLVNSVLGALIHELRAGKPVKFPFTPSGMLRFAHSVLRFGAELTPEVSPPFVLHLLTPDRKWIMRRVEGFCPLSDSDLALPYIAG